jgi:hypothetical protein
VLERKMLRDTSDSQETIVTQRPYADGPLIATLDALVYFALGFKVKIEWGTDHQSIEVAFRCVNIVGPPPLSAMHFDAARTAFDSLVQDLTRA